MLRLEPRAQISRMWRYASPLLALAITVVLGVLLFAALGKDPVRALQVFFWDPIKTPYAMVIHNDDFVLPAGVEHCLSQLESHPDYIAWGGHVMGFDLDTSGKVAVGFFMGIAGGLGALNFEIVTAEVVGAGRSGAYLLFTFLGGATFFFGPIIGAVLMVICGVLLSELTKAWLLYLGLIFLFMVMYAPGGFASLILMNLRVAAFGKLRQLWTSYLALGGTALAALVGAATMIEMVYHRQLNEALGPELRFMGATLNSAALDAWFGAGLLIVVGLVAVLVVGFVWVWRNASKKEQRRLKEGG